MLAELAHAVPRLTLTATYGDRAPGVRAQHAPAPVNVDAVSAMDALHRWLMGTALRLAAVTRKPLEGRTPFDLEWYLRSNMPRLRSLSWAPDLHPALDALLKDCERAAHLAAHKEFAGTCQTEDCGAELFVAAGQDRTTCKVCGAEYEAVQEWRTGAKTYARQVDADTIGYPTMLAQRLARVHGLEVGADYIRVLASRGLLHRANAERGDDGKKLRAMYRLGDIKDLIDRAAPKREEGVA
ncbi:hypothetical protein AB4Z38_07005 [Arthrobacter sp. 2RAF6]|uniref:hypothetical protein n=1 Tax=Arthrobacter sp. 2RAF6 TaxID=3233002 RepID=UPI003F9118FB